MHALPPPGVGVLDILVNGSMGHGHGELEGHQEEEIYIEEKDKATVVAKREGFVMASPRSTLTFRHAY